MRRLRKALTIGLGAAGVGVLLALSPPGLALEERFGLTWLFRVRGPVEPPTDVLVVSLDQQSAERLRLPEKLRDWPRTVHARLIDRLAEAGAAVIALDLIFDRRRESDPDQDHELARAIADAEVVLLEYLRSANRELATADGDVQGLVRTEQVVQPLPELVEAAAGLAPFPLPKVPARVSQFWAFKPGAGGRPTLPVVALQRFAAPVADQWDEMLEDAAGRGPERTTDDPGSIAAAVALQRDMIATRGLFRNDPGLGPRLAARLTGVDAEPRERRLLAALSRAYAGPDSRYLNFYGPAGQMPTVPIHRMLEADPGAPPLSEVAGRAVFVGLSELINLHADGFTTVFSRDDGVDLSGVEIAATAFGNLLEGSLIEPAAWWLDALLLAGFGLAVGLAAGLLPALIAVPVALALGAAYFAGAQSAFTNADHWLPLATPLGVQLPLGLFVGLLVQYRDAQRARANISRGVRYYLPEKLAAELAEGLPDPASSTELVFSTCMVTDAERFTTVAESMPPQELTTFLNGYFGLLFGAVRHEGGVVTDVVGDGTTAVWTSPTPDRARRAAACRAALEIQRGLTDTSQRPQPRLPTRIGLHSGWVVVGNVGGSGRFVYSVIGDIVNTAARIETLNKQLGTRLLATSAVVEGLEDLTLRPLGRFQVFGKTEALEVFEILALKGEAVASARLEQFAEALGCFQAERWDQARARFEAILERLPGDGPARFYLHRLLDYARNGPPPGDPTLIRMTSK